MTACKGLSLKGDKESIEYLTDAEIKAFESLHPFAWQSDGVCS